jgi:hypothetical protein
LNPYFRNLSIVVALACFALAGVWLLAPQFLVTNWGLDNTSSVGVLGRRIAVLMMGLGILSVAFRNAAPPARTVLVRVNIVLFLGTAALGFFELIFGTVTMGILPACFIEIALAMAYLNLVRRERHQVKKENL